MSASIRSSISTSQLQDIKVSSDDVLQAISNLKNACFRHGYLPQCIRDCVIVPVPKSGKDPTSSTNYR
ncbi:hypothetical protein GBAR_LOCUS26285, partial [Geodia barretti]